MKTILVAIDFSDVSDAVIEAGSKFARLLGEGLHIIHVVESEPTYAAYGFSPDEFPAMQAVQTESIKRSESKLAEIVSRLNISDVQTAVLEGQPLHCILDYAEDINADLIVLGSHGHGLLGSLLLGSVAEGCVRKAKFPALIIPSAKKDE